MLPFARWAESASVAAPCTQDADQSAERSFAAGALWALLVLPVQPLPVVAERSAVARLAEQLAQWSLPRAEAAPQDEPAAEARQALPLALLPKLRAWRAAQLAPPVDAQSELGDV